MPADKEAVQDFKIVSCADNKCDWHGYRIASPLPGTCCGRKPGATTLNSARRGCEGSAHFGTSAETLGCGNLFGSNGLPYHPPSKLPRCRRWWTSRRPRNKFSAGAPSSRFTKTASSHQCRSTSFWRNPQRTRPPLTNSSRWRDLRSFADRRSVGRFNAPGPAGPRRSLQTELQRFS